MALQRVTKFEGKVRSRITRNGNTVHLVAQWLLTLECGHFATRNQTDRLEPPKRARCPHGCPPKEI